MIEKFVSKFKKTTILVWLILLALALRWSVLEVYVIPETGMIPTLFANDHIFVNKLAYGLRLPFVRSFLVEWSQPRRGDIIVFRAPFDSNSLSIRRIVGLPGDRIFFEHGNLYINEKKIEKKNPFKKIRDFSWVRDEDFSDGGMTADKTHYVHWEENIFGRSYSVLLRKSQKAYLIFGPYRIPPDRYFVMGDNRDRVQDSRTWPSQIQRAIGKVTFSRANAGLSILIPKGTLIRTSHSNLPEYFETLKTVRLNGLFVDVEVRAKKGGLSGNVPAGHINAIEGNFPSSVSVRNAQALHSGKDENLVLKSDIIGRVQRVWFSCERTVSFADFLCDPRFIRWGRTFRSVQP